MTSFTPRVLAVAAICAALSVPASAQEQGGFLDNIFGRPNAPRQEQLAQLSGADMVVRFERLENQIRQLTGVVEQLQFRNQQLEQQLKRMQDDNEYRFQELGARGGSQPQMQQTPAQQPSRPPAGSQRRGDAFDPNQSPNAPGAPRTLGGMPATAAIAPPQDSAVANDEPPVGVPGGRTAGAPLDLSTLSANASRDPALSPDGQQASLGNLPPPPARNPNATGAQVAAVPPTQTPKDEFALGYGYLQRKDYALAEETLREFLKKFPRDRLAAEAEFWVGESLFQRQRYRDAAESFLRVSTKYNGPAKAPDALLRLAQSLAALALRQTVEREQKRVKC
jgi:tol-pal system protein YbgF